MVSLAVKDLEKSINFYRNGLELPMIDSPPTVAFFDLNGTWLGLCERSALANDATVSSKGSGYSGFNLCHNVTTEGGGRSEDGGSSGGRCNGNKISAKSPLGRLSWLFC